MELAIPVFNETFKREGEKTPLYRCCALFNPGMSAEDSSLRRATSRLMGRMRKELNHSGRSWNHQKLARMIFNPQLQGKRYKLVLDLDSRRVKVNYFLVKFELLNRSVVYIPKLPQLWFDLDESDSLAGRATDVLQQYFRDANSNESGADRPENYAIGGESWVSLADLTVRTDPVSEQELEQQMLALFSNQQMDGGNELYRVGRCLDQRYPDDLERTMLREDQVAELDRLSQHFSRRPVLLIGPRSVGKTALIHELVYRRVSRRKKPNSPKNNIWWLSPQRLITGMSYVGQWENRLLAILSEAEKQDHILYVDDVMSMFRAGQSRDSNLCVADLIKNSLQARQVRFMAEMTSEQFQALATRDRGFADLFHVVHVKPTTPQETRQIAIRTLQQLELENRCVFQFDVLPTATKLQQNHAQTEAFPGKLVKFLTALAIKNRSSSRIDKAATIKQFQATTGLAYAMLDEESIFSYDRIRLSMAERIVGQKKAVETCAKIVSIAKSRLNESDRPLGTLLFVGPTGVGKTECAKALCQVMFRDKDRLIRIDLNQFKSAYSAGTLVGTDTHPEGLLTSAIRERPFSILLLDEIEKAHPDVFDILLQVLGEGRLTDSLGRTADFSNCVVIMTSNLGTRRSEQGIGFAKENSEHRFVRAAKDFFRPEFFNRLDEVVPFEKLKRKEIARIAHRLIENIIKRQGLVRRQCLLCVDDSAIDQVVELGYHPTLGARAMKRALEEGFTAPVARTLSNMKFDQPKLIRVFIQNQQLDVDVLEVTQAKQTRPKNFQPDPVQLIDVSRSLLRRVMSDVLAERPAGEISSSGLTPELLRYFAIDEQVIRVSETLSQLEDQLAKTRAPEATRHATVPVRRKSTKAYGQVASDRNLMKEICAAKDIESYLSEQQVTHSYDPISDLKSEVIDQSALLSCMVDADATDRATLYLRSIRVTSGETIIDPLRRSLDEFFESGGFESSVSEVKYGQIKGASMFVFALAGPCISSIVDAISGSHLHIDSNGRMSLFQIGSMPQGDIEHAGAQRTIEKYLGNSAFSIEERNPFAIRPVQRIQTWAKFVDLQSGLVVKRHALQAADWQRFLMRGLTLPPEFDSLTDK